MRLIARHLGSRGEGEAGGMQRLEAGQRPGRSEYHEERDNVSWQGFPGFWENRG